MTESEGLGEAESKLKNLPNETVTILGRCEHIPRDLVPRVIASLPIGSRYLIEVLRIAELDSDGSWRITPLGWRCIRSAGKRVDEDWLVKYEQPLESEFQAQDLVERLFDSSAAKRDSR